MKAGAVWALTFAAMAILLWLSYTIAYFVGSQVHRNIVEDYNYYALLATGMTLSVGTLPRSWPISKKFSRELEYVATLPSNRHATVMIEFFGPTLSIVFATGIFVLCPLAALSHYLQSGVPVFWITVVYSVSIAALSLAINMWSLQHSWIQQWVHFLLAFLVYSSFALYPRQYLESTFMPLSQGTTLSTVLPVLQVVKSGLSRLSNEPGTPDINNPVRSYSRGTRQKLAIVRAIMVNPRLIIMDEPFNTLDPFAVDMVKRYLTSLDDATMLVSSHIVSNLEGFADTLAVLKNGSIVHFEPFSSSNIKENIPFWFGHNQEE